MEFNDNNKKNIKEKNKEEKSSSSETLQSKLLFTEKMKLLNTQLAERQLKAPQFIWTPDILKEKKKKQENEERRKKVFSFFFFVIYYFENLQKKYVLRASKVYRM